ncbi:Lipid-A-disaccharide synthase protein [Marine Group I thaumarchaeote SCGC AAA799-P11]|uniref:Lipid-A-disaccharide synthase protein n=1 Tax=Marine Group I thaumarchaeote SCGC AAA799-P11 TaxID=1502295 RepID=A0A087RWT8_9ARCH|nr:Lipid-A-disaccharide synthase protein [Marine Group I thaumarchaeote SCGC AAA799-P11]
MIRVEEEYASYVSKSSNIISIIKKIVKEFEKENIVILCRYPSQIKKIKNEISGKPKILSMSFDGKHLLKNSDVFIGSGGTMTAESSLLGTPTISYNAVPNIVEEYLVKKHLVKRETEPEKICDEIKKIFHSSKTQYVKKAKIEKLKMENPIEKLVKIIRE